MATGSATKTHGYALLVSSRDPHVIDQHGTIALVADGATYDFAGISNLVVNFGVISNVARNGIAVDLERNGLVLNAGRIEASGAGGVGIRIVSQAAAGSGAVVINAGTISGKLDGIDFPAGGVVINTTGALIEGGRYGIDVPGGPGTIVDAGTIAGGTDAIHFAGSFSDRVILERGAVLDGKVIGGSGSNTLELGGALGGTGTLSGFASEFVNFGTVTIDAGASWKLAAAATIGSGVTLTDSGTLSNAGQIDTTVTVSSGGSLDNSGSILAPGSAGAYGQSGLSGVLSSGAVTNGGTIVGGESLSYVLDQEFLYGGAGGTGVNMQALARLTNDGSISGAIGGSIVDYGSYVDIGGNGGQGVVLASGGSLASSGVILGGAGGDGTGGYTSYGGHGGTAVVLQSQGVLTNSGIISGGAGGNEPGEGVGFGRGGYGGGGVVLSTGVVTNSGTISGGDGGYSRGSNYAFGGAGGIGLELRSGNVTNSGTIRGGNGGFGTNNNYAVGGGGGSGLMLLSGGTVSNDGIIDGGSGGSAFAFNMARNGAGGAGISIGGGGLVTNDQAGIITGSGANGITIAGGAGTVVDAGTISGSDAIVFSGNYADRVILDPGAVLNGAVIGGSGTNTLELATGGFGSTGTVSSFGTAFEGFGTITLDTGGSWLLDGAAPAAQAVTLMGDNVLSLNDTAAFSDPILGFSATDALDLRDLAYTAGATASLSADTLTVRSGGTIDTLTLSGLSAGTMFQAGNDGAGHVLIDEVVSPAADRAATASLRFLAKPAATTLPSHAVFSGQASREAMAGSLLAFMRQPSAPGARLVDAAGGLQAAPQHALAAGLAQWAAIGVAHSNSLHPGLLHHGS